MIRLTLRAPGLDAPIATTLDDGDAIVVGRAPDGAGLGALVPRGAKARTVAVTSSGVSGRHCVISTSGDGVRVRDLSSKNGSWLRVASGHSATIDAPDVDLHLAALPHGAPTDAAEPLPASRLAWNEPSEFAAAVAREINAWLAHRGAAEVVNVEARGASSALPSFHLADGSGLVLAARGGGTADLDALERLADIAAFVDAQNAYFDQESGHDDDFVMRSPKFRAAHARVFDAAQRGSRLLLLGPSGSGKERLARCYHAHSPRAEAPFKAVHCGLLEKEMLWVQLFGAARGSYTGAVKDIVGAVEHARGGTLFLDEVADLSPSVQTALLRFLDSHGEYERLGDPQLRHADVRIVCATNADLRSLVAQGRFREDLWYRFTASVVPIPALRERPEDLIAWLRARELSPGVSAYDAIDAEGRDALLAHDWPGNFRELDNFVSRLPGATRANSIGARVCRDAIGEGSTRTPASAVSTSRDNATDPSLTRLLAAAAQAYEQDHDGSSPRTLGDVRALFEDYLRPLFVAHGCGVASQLSMPEGINYSALARRLDIADGTTVRKNLARFFARFGRDDSAR